MKIVTTCPRTKKALYVSDVKPSLLNPKAKGDWGYSTDHNQAIELTESQARIAMSDMTFCGRNPRAF